MDYLIVYMEILALAFIYTTILFFNVRTEMGSDLEVRFFQVLMLTLMIALVIDGFTHAQYRGFLHMPPLLVAFLCATYAFLLSGVLSYLWFVFAELRMGFYVFNNKKMLFISILPALAISFMCFATIWTGWLFSVDENGIYSRGPLWILQSIIPYAYFLFITVHAIISGRKEQSSHKRKQYYVLAMFVIAPFLGALLQLFVGNHPFVAPSTSIAMLFIFLNIQGNMINQDSLTGLHNRRSVEQYIEEMKSRVTETDSFYLYVMDIDDFKMINDTHGHIEGDRILRRVSNLLQKTADEYGGIIGRLGGDEFIGAIRTGNIRRPEDFELSFNEALRKEKRILGLNYSLSMSFGFARCKSAQSDTNSLINEADKVMYGNKERKRNRREASDDLYEGTKEDWTIDRKKDELNKYIDITTRIRELYSPGTDGIEDPEVYRMILMDSFKEIGELAKDNQQILDNIFYPLVDEEKDLEDDEIELLRDFSSMLVDATSMENLDMPLFYTQSRKLLDYAESQGDDKVIILALDNIVIASYAMMAYTLRLSPECNVCFKYRDMGLKAADRLMEYLEPEAFAALPDDYCRETVLINARYVSSLYVWDDMERDEYIKMNDKGIAQLERALALAYDPFYRKQAPDYNWDYHIFRTIQYMAGMSEYRDYSMFTREQAEKIYQYSLKLTDFLNNERPDMVTDCSDQIQRLYTLRGEFITGRVDAEGFKKGLLEIWEKRDYSGESFWEVLPNLCVPYEYMQVTDKDDLSRQDIDFLNEFYSEVMGCVNKPPKVGMLVFLLTTVTYTLRSFIKVPGGPSFEDFTLKLLAVVHPLTHVHVLSVADFAACITDHLLERKPELFIGLLNCETVEDVRGNKDRFIDFIRHGALLHDVGKLYINETMITYGRKLLPLEFDLIESHTKIGADILEEHEETGIYGNMARGHHKWYDDSAGYPKDFVLQDAEDKVMIAILTVADCLDASTDFVGRNYKKGKTLEEFLDELSEGKGTRYADYVVELMEEEAMRKEISELLPEARDENYRKTYDLLKKM